MKALSVLIRNVRSFVSYEKILLVTTILLMTLVLCSCSKEDKESSVYSEPMSTAMTSDESQLQISSATATDSSDNTDISDTSSQKPVS